MEESRSSAGLLRMLALGEAWLGEGAYLTQGLRGDPVAMLRPGWSVEDMAEWISNMEAHMGQEFYQLFHYEDIGRFCSNNYIPNIDHRWSLNLQ